LKKLLKYERCTDWTQSLERVGTILETADVSKLWVSRDGALETLACVCARFNSDFSSLSEGMAFIFSGDKDSRSLTRKTIELIRGWHRSDQESDQAPSLASIVAVAMDYMGFDADQHTVLVDAVMTSAVLGDIRVDLPYHNNLHFHKVVLHAVRLIAIHNHLFEGTGIAFDHSKVAAILSAGAIHDLGHEGKSNIKDQKYCFAFTERRSYEMAVPFFEQAGLEQKTLDDIKVMLITTDASPFGDPISPVSQLRAAYEYHFGTSDSDELALHESLGALEDRPDLALMCMILHEADLMNSNGLSYDMAMYETALLSEEMGKKDACPEDLYLFLNKTCCGGMLTDAWQHLAKENFREIYERALADVRAGDKPYLAPEKSYFLNTGE